MFSQDKQMFLYHRQFDGPLNEREKKLSLNLNEVSHSLLSENCILNPRSSEAAVMTHVTAVGLAHSPID